MIILIKLAKIKIITLLKPFYKFIAHTYLKNKSALYPPLTHYFILIKTRKTLTI